MSTLDDVIWNALPRPLLLLDKTDRVERINSAAEYFLAISSRTLHGRSLTQFLSPDNRLIDLIARTRAHQTEMAEYDVNFEWPERPPCHADIVASPLADRDNGILLLIHPRMGAERINRTLNSRSAARSVAGMAAMLAHEIKNPLAGISGAAQLIELSLPDQEQELTTLIRDEAARIGALVARVEQFGDIGPPRRKPVNVHDVLDRASRIAKAGFASHVRFATEFDPSLPPVPADPDQLLQVVINLLKNAAEATRRTGGVITLRTAYHPGIKVSIPGGRQESLPLMITITDDGVGVPEDLQQYLFEPFVTSKATGSGLGLALVSKIIADHGGMIACESQPGATAFRILLPVAENT